MAIVPVAIALLCALANGEDSEISVREPHHLQHSNNYQNNDLGFAGFLNTGTTTGHNRDNALEFDGPLNAATPLNNYENNALDLTGILNTANPLNNHEHKAFDVEGTLNAAQPLDNYNNNILNLSGILQAGMPYNEMHRYPSDEPDDSQKLIEREQKHGYGPPIPQLKLEQEEILTSRTGNGFQGAIHSVVIEGKFGHPLTQNINKTFEYLFEFTYNETRLEVCETFC